GRPREASLAVRQSRAQICRRFAGGSARVRSGRPDSDTNHHGSHRRRLPRWKIRFRVCLARRSAQEVKDTIDGNQIRVRLVKGVSRQMSKAIGFVHNPDSDPDVLLRLTQSLLQHIGAAAGKRAPKKFTGDRWLVVANQDGLSHIETYRHVYSQLSIPTDFKKILIVLAGGRIETLTG